MATLLHLRYAILCSDGAERFELFNRFLEPRSLRSHDYFLGQGKTSSVALKSAAHNSRLGSLSETTAGIGSAPQAQIKMAQALLGCLQWMQYEPPLRQLSDASSAA
jgi:hypothetical protein